MFIKKISKPDRKGNNIYTYYRLVRSYKVGNKNRQQTIHQLGKLENIPREKHKLLADRIETILLGSNELLFSLSPEIESVANKFAKEIIEKGIFSISKTSKPTSLFKEIEEDYQSINIKSQEELESK